MDNEKEWEILTRIVKAVNNNDFAEVEKILSEEPEFGERHIDVLHELPLEGEHIAEHLELYTKISELQKGKTTGSYRSALRYAALEMTLLDLKPPTP